jgi:CRISPR-associated exonuclease Cas4
MCESRPSDTAPPATTAEPFAEADLLPLSALQHLAFCERQCALIHIENAWAENRLTAQGRLLHERVHERDDESRGDVRVARGLRLRSLRLGLVGQADVVEFHRQPDGAWRPFPVEYKRGRAKRGDCDRIQLCAQALCLEEMTGTAVPEGALFYGTLRRREVVALDATLRAAVTDAARRLHALIDSGRTPPATYAERCDNCSLLTLCRPRMPAAGDAVERYIARALEAG